MRSPYGSLKSLTEEQRREHVRQKLRRSYEKNLAKIQAKREANREAAKEYARKYREENPDKSRESRNRSASRSEAKENRKRYEAENGELIKAKKREWNQKTWPIRRDVAMAKHAEWYRKTKWHLKRHHERWGTDPDYKIKCVLRNRLRDAVRGNFHSGIAVDLLGCTVAYLRCHLESLFQPGMTWENRGLRGWHIDHIKALANFDLTDPEQVAEACHYTNLQPLWAADNIRKGAKAA